MTDPHSTPTPPVIFGVVLRDLVQYRDLVLRIAHSPWVVMTDFVFGAPIFKGSDAIKSALATATSATDKFTAYATHAILDESERLRFARLFAQQYLRRSPASERSDVFLASGEVLKFTFEVALPGAHPEGAALAAGLEQTPHDAAALAALLRQEPVASAHLRAELKIFLDHVFNPRRHELPRVREAARALGVERPIVLELVTDGALPHYLERAVAPEVAAVGGRVVLLPG